MAEKIKIAELNFDTDKLDAALLETRKDIDSLTEGIRVQRKTIKDSNKAINEFTQANLKLANSGKKNSKQYKDNQAEIKKLKSAIDNETKALIKNETSQKNLKNEQKEINNVITIANAKRGQSVDYINKAKNALAQEVTTIKQARDQNKRLNTIRNNVNTKTKEGQIAIENLNKRLDKNNKFIDKNADKLTKQKNNIGNYGSALGGVSPILGQVSQKLTAVKEALNVFAVSMKTTNAATGKTSKALKIFKFALISTGIGAIVVILGSLITFLATTQAGIDKVTSVTRPLQAIFQSFIGVVQTLGGSLFKALSEPKKLLTDLVDFVKNNVINRFKAFGVILEAIQNRDFKGLRDGILQATTGVENLVDKTKDAGKKTAAFLKEAADKGDEIDRLQKSIEQGEADLILTRSKSQKQLRNLQLIANDRTLSAKKNNEAAEKALTIANNLADAEKSVINEKIKQEEIQQTLNDSGRKDLTKLNTFKAQLNTADEKARATELKFLTAKAGLANEEKKRQADASKAAIENSQKKLEQIVSERELALESFDLQNEGMQGTLKEELDFYREQSAQKLSIFKAQLAAEKLSQQEYNLAVEKLSRETQQNETEATAYYIEQRLSKEREALAQRVEDVKRLSNEEVQARKDAADKIYDDQLKSLEAQNKAGLLSQKEFNSASDALDASHQLYKDELDAQYRLQKAEDEKLRKTLEQEQKLLDEDNEFQRKMDRLDFEFAAEQKKLEEQKDAGDISEENYLAKLELMTEKHTQAKSEIESAQQDNKIALYSDAAGQVASILGKETAAGKFFATAQALMDTYSAANLALKTIPPPFSYVAAAATVVAGLANVKKINTTKTQMYTGGISGDGYTGQGGKFTRTGYTHAGEVVFNQEDVRSLGGAQRVNNMRPTESGFGSMPTGIRNDDNDNDKWDQIGELLKNGVKEGSEQGTNNGIVDYSDNIDVKQKAVF